MLHNLARRFVFKTALSQGKSLSRTTFLRLLQNVSARQHPSGKLKQMLPFRNVILATFRFQSHNSTADKEKKVVGTWLRSRRTKVIGAVILGSAILYYVILFEIYTIVGEIVKTTRKS